MEALSAAMVKAELSECDVRAALEEHLDSIACHYHNIMVGSTTVNIKSQINNYFVTTLG